MAQLAPIVYSPITFNMSGHQGHAIHESDVSSSEEIIVEEIIRDTGNTNTDDELYEGDQPDSPEVSLVLLSGNCHPCTHSWQY